MSTIIKSTVPTINDLGSIIEKMKSDRQAHLDAICSLDDIAAKYGVRLVSDDQTVFNKRGQKKSGQKRSRRRFEVSGPNMIKALIGSARTPMTSAQINQEWSKEGRAGRPDNILTKLVKEGIVRRDPAANGQRGGQYTLITQAS